MFLFYVPSSSSSCFPFSRMDHLASRSNQFNQLKSVAWKVCSATAVIQQDALKHSPDSKRLFQEKGEDSENSNLQLQGRNYLSDPGEDNNKVKQLRCLLHVNPFYIHVNVFPLFYKIIHIYIKISEILRACSLF